MGADQNFDWNQAAASALDWWREAGVDANIDECPRNWLARPAPLPAADPNVTIADAVTASGTMPDTLAAFEAWRVGPETPEAAWHGRAIAAQGDAAANIMIVIDMPEREDGESGVLMSGAAGRLFDRMLAAIGLSRETVYLVPLCNSRPAAGRIAPEIEARLSEILKHHIALAAPKRVLLMGNAPSRALLGMDFLRARGGLRTVNHAAGTVAVDFQGVATFHPRFLIEQPAKKAEAWKDLRMLIGGLES
ncbi:uracil-DNA glycosylase [Sphingomonas sp. Leaf357]|uniref:uracil-DNA glycosylase n=1 Tax=Sphingomonas sp. Leaf357 TaxID=1736350 RepID=UPI0006F8F4A6|nr:uracil-DNA glycosylase [Sphingomonas sp. Leaf357]KQS04910.1 uracil-DNA glycosylase [Sphingomonas sp. Leaf357]